MKNGALQFFHQQERQKHKYQKNENYCVKGKIFICFIVFPLFVLTHRICRSPNGPGLWNRMCISGKLVRGQKTPKPSPSSFRFFRFLPKAGQSAEFEPISKSTSLPKPCWYGSKSSRATVKKRITTLSFLVGLFLSPRTLNNETSRYPENSLHYAVFLWCDSTFGNLMFTKTLLRRLRKL